MNKNNIKKLYNKYKAYIIIFLIAFCIFIPYMQKGIIKGDDYICHTSNIFSIDKYISFKDSNFFPQKINPIMANNTGYGNALFYPQLGYWSTIIIHLIIKRFGFSLISSIKVFEFVTVFLAGTMMYKMTKLVFKNKKVSLASSIIYMCSPYFLNDVFLRMAYTEMITFVFIPMVFIGIYYLLCKEYKKFLIYFVIGYSGMVMSHLVLTIFFSILLFIILIINLKEVLNKKAVLYIFLAILLIFGITSPFTIPMLEHKVKGEYVVFQSEGMANIKKIHEHRLDLEDLFMAGNNKAKPKYISVITIILAAITLIKYKELNKEKVSKKIFIGICVMTVISVIMTLKIINWNYIPKILWNIQFPWRMCTFISFGFSVIAGIAIMYFKNKEIQNLLLIIICLFMLTDASNIIRLKTIDKKATISKNEVSSLENKACGARKEYLPIKAKNNIEYLKNRKEEVLIKSGNEQDIEILENKTPYLKFKINLNNTEETTVEIPRLYYLGYTINIKNDQGEIKNIEYYENENGFIEFEIDKSGIVTVGYTGTMLNKISNILAIISIAILFFICISKKIKNNKKTLIKE